MRKGFVVTLGVVALILAVSPGFAVAPIISCVPDIIVSDVEQNTQTEDINFFIFSDALNLDDYVQDSDTSVTALRWCFIESTGNAIMINGILSNPGNITEPGAYDIRAGTNGMIAVQNVQWSDPGTGPPWSDPGAGATMQSTIELYASDGTNTDSTGLIIETVNATMDQGTPDGLRAAQFASFPFTANAEGWQWFSMAPTFPEPTHSWAAGSLQMEETAPHTSLVFGSYESPQNPAVAVHPTIGCVMRARYTMRSSVDDANCPSFRLRAITKHMIEETPGNWIIDFSNQDFNADIQLLYQTYNALYVAGRAPGAGQVYTLLAYPVQVSTLEDDDVVMYFSCDLLDIFGALEPDAGILYLDEVVIDGMDNPAIGSGTSVAELTSSNLLGSGWVASTPTTLTATGDITGLTCTVGQTAVISVQPGNNWYDAYAESQSPGVALEPGRYYRATFYITSSELDTGPAGPRARCSWISSRFALSCDKELAGGSLLARFDQTQKPYEVWLAGPSDAGTGMSEAIRLKFECWEGPSNSGWPFFRDISGTLTLHQVITESFPAP